MCYSVVLQFSYILEISTLSNIWQHTKIPKTFPGGSQKRLQSTFWSLFFVVIQTPIPPPEQKNAPNSAQKVPRRHSEQKKVSFPARKGMPTASRAEKCPKSCAEGALRRLQAEKGIISCAERDTNRLPGRKTPQIRRGGCSEAVPGRKRYHFLRRRCSVGNAYPFLFL